MVLGLINHDSFVIILESECGRRESSTLICWNRLVAMTRDCKSLGFGLRRFESYFQHHTMKKNECLRSIFYDFLDVKKIPTGELRDHSNNRRYFTTSLRSEPWKHNPYCCFVPGRHNHGYLRTSRTRS